MLTAALIVVTAGTFSFSTFSGGEPWIVPPKNANTANPVKSDAKTVATGKKLYIKNCEECHGKKGMGDGSKAVDLKVAPKDLSATATQSQSDGSLFYKISEKGIVLDSAFTKEQNTKIFGKFYGFKSSDKMLNKTIFDKKSEEIILYKRCLEL